MIPLNWRFLSHLFFLISCTVLVLCEAAEEHQKSAGGDLIVASSIAVNTFKIQTTAPRASVNKKYGYPYLIAPTLMPLINSRSDEEENEAIAPVAMEKRYDGKLSTAESESSAAKKNVLKKQKAPQAYSTNRRHGYDDGDYKVQRLRPYKEPKYRNFDELESQFRPRRISKPYSEYYRPKTSRPQVSQRDPYRSPSKEPVDAFYPLTKTRSYTTTYKQSGRNSPVYGNGRYDEPVAYYGGHSGYKTNNYDTSTKYPSDEDTYYEADYTIESNKPIVGDIRKRLLDYAGASDLYEGEPDYLRQVAQNKHKYGHIGNDYYAYGGPEYKKSYREYPYVESKVTLIKKLRSS